MTAEKYLLSEARLKRELEHMDQLEEELTQYGLLPTISTTNIGGFALNDTASLRIIGSILQDYYAAVENIFRAIATTIDQNLPTGEHWHKELLLQMTLHIDGLRYAVITPETAHLLEPYRGFRPEFCNVYGTHLAFDRMKELLCRLSAMSTALRQDLTDFRQKMRQLYRL